MAKRKNRRSGAQRRVSANNQAPTESRAAEAITIAWTVTITTLIFCHLITLAAHGYVLLSPEAKKMLLLREMILFAGAVVGVLSMLLLPFVLRYRQVPPPRGVVVFGICLAIAPILVLVLRAVG